MADRTNYDKRTKAELDPTILDKVVAVLSVGAGRQAASAQAGISDETLRFYEQLGMKAWSKLERAFAEDSDVVLTDREVLFADFHDRVRKADTNIKTYMLEVIQKAAGTKDKPGDWKAGAWLVEKLYPLEFGSRMKIQAEVSGSVATRPDLTRLTSKELWQFKQLLAKTKKEDP